MEAKLMAIVLRMCPCCNVVIGCMILGYKFVCNICVTDCQTKKLFMRLIGETEDCPSCRKEFWDGVGDGD